MKGKTVRVLLLAGIFLVAGAFGLRHLNADTAEFPPLNTVVAEQGDVAQRVVAQGRLRPVQKVDVGSQVSGNVDAIYVDFNSKVTRGQVIAQIDPSTFEAAARAAAAELRAAEASAELARVSYERIQVLGENMIVPPADVEQARASVLQAETQLTVRQNALDRAQRELDRCTIYSPTDGIVISRNIDVGQTVAASLSAPTLFEIATDLSEMRIHANVSEADVGRVIEGQLVRFNVDAHRGRTFEGTVMQVRNAPIMESNVVHYETIISVNNEEGLLKPGMTAEVSIITAEVTDVVRVRNTGLRARLPDALVPPDPEPLEGANGQVYRLRGGSLEAVRVRTGLTDGTMTEIVSGLQAGDTLVVGLLPQADRDANRRTIFGGNQAQF
jgi:HlyD family secretion protein